MLFQLRQLTDHTVALHRLAMVEKYEKKRVLLISSWFPEDVGRRTLMSEFADAVVAAGHEIDVIAIDWRDVDQTDQPTAIHKNLGMNVYRFKPLLISQPGKSIRLIAKWIGTSLKAVATTIRLLRRHKYDVIVAHAPSPVWAPVLICNLFSRSKKYLIQWDFVPYHQRAVGMMNGKITFNVLLFLERILVRGFDTIGCMSEKNIDFLKAHYWLKPSQRIEILPIWSEPAITKSVDRAKVRRQHGLALEKKIAVFGGTLSLGRGLEDIFKVARLSSEISKNLLFLIVGRGPLENELRELTKEMGNLCIMHALPRDKYQDLLFACDCGIVATQKDTGVPTFPSKTMDYFRVGLPVVASVESSTDFGEFLELNSAGMSVLAGDHEALHNAITVLCSDTKMADRFAKNGRLLLEGYFNVANTVEQIVRS